MDPEIETFKDPIHYIKLDLVVVTLKISGISSFSVIRTSGISSVNCICNSLLNKLNPNINKYLKVD